MKFENYEKAKEISEKIDSLQTEIDLCRLMIEHPEKVNLRVECKPYSNESFIDQLCIDRDDEHTFLNHIATTLISKYEQKVKDLIAEFERIE